MHWPEVVFLDDPVTGLKQDTFNDLVTYIEEGLENRNLKQIFFTSESETLARRLGAEELLISCDWFTTRMAA